MHVLPEYAVNYDVSSLTEVHSATSQLQNRTIGYDISAFSNIFLCAVGKAAEPMARYFLSQLGNRITDGVIITKERSTSSMHGLPVYNGGHPLPNEESIHNGNRVMALAEKADANTLVINAISGGASALCLAPWQDPSISITLANYRTMMRLLLSNAVPIEKCNCIRSHISHIKGGKYLQHIFPALSLSFILSDVRYDNTRAIASGLTDPHRYSATNAIGILNEYHLWTRTPAPIRTLLQQTQHAEQQNDTQSASTTHAMPHTQSARHTAQPPHAPHASNQNIIIGNTYRALQAAHKSASARGYTPIILTDCLAGEACHAAQFIASVCAFHLRHPAAHTPKVCLLFGGETTVTVTGTGKGGRNQELALAFLKIALEDEVLRKMQAHFAMISVATDGNDGPTDAAGGIIDADTTRIMHKKNISIKDALHNNDSYHFLKKNA